MRGYGLFYLPAFPVLPNTTMTFVLATLNDRGSGISGGEDWNMTELVEFDDFIVDRQNGILRNLNGAFVSGNRNYRSRWPLDSKSVPRSRTFRLTLKSFASPLRGVLQR